GLERRSAKMIAQLRLGYNDGFRPLPKIIRPRSWLDTGVWTRTDHGATVTSHGREGMAHGMTSFTPKRNCRARAPLLDGGSALRRKCSAKSLSGLSNFATITRSLRSPKPTCVRFLTT